MCHATLQGSRPDRHQPQRPPLEARSRHALHRGGRDPLPRQRIFPGRWRPRHPPGGPGLGIPLSPPPPAQGRCPDGGPERQLPLGPTPPSVPRPALRPCPAHARAPGVVPLAPPCGGPHVCEPARLRRCPRPHLPPDPLRSCPHHGGALRLQLPVRPSARADHPP